MLTGDSFFHLSAFGWALPGLNLCGAGRVVCLIDPVGDVYACPFAIHENFLAGNVRRAGGFEAVWKTSSLFAELRKPDTGGACRSCGFYDSCRGGCMAAKFFTGLPLDGPDPECVQGYGETALASVSASPGLAAPRPSVDHSHRTAPRGLRGGAAGGPVPVSIAPPPPAVPRLRREPAGGLRGVSAGCAGRPALACARHFGMIRYGREPRMTSPGRSEPRRRQRRLARRDAAVRRGRRGDG